MPHDDHYAIVLTINRYPGLSDLHGPENDGDEFRRWLLDPKYGDLAPQHIQVIRSQDYGVAATPDDANPTETELKKALNRWLRTQTGWQGRIGQRLYLFFAGHGFTAGSTIHDPALFSAVAQNGDTAHIAVLRYASKIANAGFFDEILLVTDCCQDVLKASQVLEPTWNPPDRQRTADVRLFQAYGAPRGRQSFERDIGQNGEYRGLFTSVLLEALCTASPDADGWVTDRSVADQFQALWADRYEQETGYTPPLVPASQKRIRIYRHSASATGLTSSQRVAVDLSRVISKSAYIDRHPAPDIHPSQPTVPMKAVAGRWLRSSDLLRLESPIVDLAPGLHLVLTPGDQPDVAFEVPYPKSPAARASRPVATPTLMPALRTEEVAPQRVILRTANPNAEITVLDASYARVSIGTGTVSLSLPQGLYKTLVRIGPVSMQSLFIVTDAPLDELLPEPQFSAAAPVAGTSNTHEYHSNRAAGYAVVPVELGGDLGETGEVFVFARDSSLRPNKATDAAPPWQSWSLSSLVGSEWERPFVQKGTDDLHGYGYLKAAATAGSLALRTAAPSGGAAEDGLVVPVIPGWRTEIYLDCAAAPTTLTVVDGDGRLALDLATASIHLVRTGSASLLLDPIGLATEAARIQLAAGRNVAVPSPEQAMASPMWALYAAQAAYQQGTQHIDRVRKCVLAVPEELREGLCDFAVLAQWLGLPTAGQPIHDPPMLATSWELAAKLEAQSGLASELFEEVGQWQTGGSLWAIWRRSIDSRGVLRWRLAKPKTDQRDLAEKDANSVTQPMLDPTWSLDTWVLVEDGLRHPNPDHSPFQQALRRRLLDALTEIRRADSEIDDSVAVSLPPGSDVFALGKQFMLSPSYVVAAYNRLYVEARRQAGLDAPIAWVSVVVDEPTLDSTTTKSKHTRHLSLDDH